MIRDQFKDVKKVTTKEARKKASMGERAYYSKRISRLQDLNRSMGVSLVITSVVIAIAYAIVFLIYILSIGTEKPYELWKFIVWTCSFAVCVGFTVVWYAAIKPWSLRQIEICRHELERLNAITISKAAATYALYGEGYKKQQEQKHLEEKQRARSLAEKKEAEKHVNKEVERKNIDGESKIKE